MSEFIYRYEKGTEPRTVLLLHGTGGDESQLMALAAQVFPGASRLGVRGKISEGGANRFFRRFAEGVFDESNVIEQTGKLADFIKDSSAKYQFDPFASLRTRLLERREYRRCAPAFAPGNAGGWGIASCDATLPEPADARPHGQARLADLWRARSHRHGGTDRYARKNTDRKSRRSGTVHPSRRTRPE